MDHDEFHCPLCGSDMFGTANPTAPPDDQRGYCKGRYKGMTCDFVWLRKDDARYFRPDRAFLEEALLRLQAENEKLKATVKDLREYIALGEPPVS